MRGVANVESFDDQEILVETEAGMLQVTGKELHIKQLDLDGGTLAVEGLIVGLEYTGDVHRKKSGDKVFSANYSGRWGIWMAFTRSCLPWASPSSPESSWGSASTSTES